MLPDLSTGLTGSRTQLVHSLQMRCCSVLWDAQVIVPKVLSTVSRAVTVVSALAKKGSATRDKI